MLQTLNAEEEKYIAENGDDGHAHKQTLKELDSKLHTTEVIQSTYS